MTAPLAVFSFQASHQVRVRIIDDEPWFCLKDVCDILTIENSRRVAAEVLDQSGVRKTDTRSGGQNRKLAFVNEPNLYRVIFRSNKPEARQFQDWVFSEVLPAIRKTGGYQYKPAPPKQAGEPLTRQDTDELAWLINDIARSFHFSRRWVSGIWFALRRATGNPSPNPILVTDLPVVIHELQRILAVAEHATGYMRKYESEVLKSVVRAGGNMACIGAIEPKDTGLQCPPARFEVALNRLKNLDGSTYQNREGQR